MTPLVPYALFIVGIALSLYGLCRSACLLWKERKR
jgi:hypothetical protein